MRVVKIMIKLIFILLLVASITLNLILGFSSTQKLALKDDLKTRITLYRNAVQQLNSKENLSNYTVLFEFSSDVSETSREKSLETISCSTNEGKNQKCISKTEEYIDSSLKRSIFFPNNGKQYFIEGESKTFVQQTEDIAAIEMSQLLNNVIHNLAKMKTDVDLWNKNQQKEGEEDALVPQMSVNTTSTFDFNTFSLSKEIAITVITPVYNEETKITSSDTEITKFKFDGKDRLIELSIDSSIHGTFYSYKISYESTKLYFPDFTEFTMKEAN